MCRVKLRGRTRGKASKRNVGWCKGMETAELELDVEGGSQSLSRGESVSVVVLQRTESSIAFMIQEVLSLFVNEMLF